MKTKQSMNLRIGPWTKKSTANGEIPVYAIITINGEEKSISLGEKISDISCWDPVRKMAFENTESASRTNFKIADIKSALNDHFLVLCAQFPDVTAEMVKRAYLNKENRIILSKTDKKEGKDLSAEIDELISQLILHYKKTRKEENNKSNRYIRERIQLLSEEREDLDKKIKAAVKRGNAFFDDLSIAKTIINAMDEWLLSLLQKTDKGITSFETLRRWPVTKNKLKAFLQHRHHEQDMKLMQLQYRFAEQFYDYLTITDGMGNNTAMKHVKNIKQLIDRAITNSWITVNALKNYRCTYEEPNQEGIVMHDIHSLINKNFEKEALNEVKDIFLFCCFTGYAYQDVLRLSSKNIIIGMDGKNWLTANRGKTGAKEDVPVLPIAQQIIDKYKDHPVCLRKNRLLPVKDNHTHNLYLKEIAKECNIERDLTTHIARHTFATTVTLENDVPLPSVQKMLGHKSIRTTEKYARATRLKISRNMNQLTGKIFTENGKLIGVSEYYGTDNTTKPKEYNQGLRVAFKK